MLVSIRAYVSSAVGTIFVLGLKFSDWTILKIQASRWSKIELEIDFSLKKKDKLKIEGWYKSKNVIRSVFQKNIFEK